MTNTTLKLPPISAMDDLLPNGAWKSPSESSPPTHQQYPYSPPYHDTFSSSLPTPPQPDQQWKSPPYQSNMYKNKIENDIDQVTNTIADLLVQAY